MSDENITLEDCEELCNEVISENDLATEEIYLWRILWRRLVHKLGQSENPDFDLFLNPPNLNEPNTPESTIAVTRAEIRKLLESHSVDSQACMNAFDKIRTTRGHQTTMH